MVKKLINDPEVKIEVNEAMKNEQIPEAKGTVSWPNTPTTNNNAGISNNVTNTSQITPQIAQTVETPDNRVTNIPVNTPETTPTPAPAQIQEPVKVEEPQWEVVLWTDWKYYKVKQAKPVEPKAETPVEALKVETVKTKQPKVEFGYQTTPEQRDQRNQSIAQIILDSWKKFDSTTIANWIRTNAPWVSEADINNTVNEIFTRYQWLEKAKANQNKITSWDWMTAEQLNQSNLWTDDLELLKSWNPNKYNELIKYKQDKQKLDTLNWKAEPAEVKKEDVFEMTTTPTLDLITLREKLYNNPEMLELQTQVNEKWKTLKDLQNEMKNILDNTRKRLEWTWATNSRIRAVAQKELEALQQQYDTASTDYELSLNNYNSMKSNADTEYQTNIDQYNINRQTASDVFEQMKYQYWLIQEEMAMRNEAIKSDIEWERKKEFLWLESKIKSEQSYIDYLQDLSKMEIENWYDEKKWVLEYKRDLAKLWIQNAYDINKSNLSYQQDLWLEKLKNAYANDRDVQNYIRDIEKLKFQYEYSPENIQKTLEMQNYNQFMWNWWWLLSILGNGKVTSHWWDYDNNFWLDVDWKVWDPIFGFEWTIVWTWSDKTAWQYVKIKLDDWKEVMLSHLNRANVKDWQRIKATDVIAEIGNTGRVIAWKWWDWSHIDIRIKENWKNIDARAVEDYLRAYNPMKTSELTASQMQQIENLKWDYYSKSGIQTLWQAGITQEMLNNYLQNKPEELTDKEFDRFKYFESNFKSDLEVRAFENALVQGKNLIASLNDESWVWDVAAIFQFMKSLDPNSVVRETEFKTAAESAWLWKYYKNTPARLREWKKLSPTQRKAFAKLAKVYIAEMWKSYNRKYDDMVNWFDNNWIPRKHLPKNATLDLDQLIGTSFKKKYSVYVDSTVNQWPTKIYNPSADNFTSNYNF